MFSVEVSPIHGRGLFATQFIPEGTLIGVIEGRPTDEDGAYVLWLDEDNAVEVHNDLKYINHSQKPNAAYFDDLTVLALTDIYPGQEITHDYGNEGVFEEEAAEEMVEVAVEVDIEIERDQPTPPIAA